MIDAPTGQERSHRSVAGAVHDPRWPGAAARELQAQRDAQAAIAEAARRRQPGFTPTVAEFFDEWLERFPRHPRTQETHQERINHYILPYLPKQGRLPLADLRRAMLRDVQAKLLTRGLAKETIDSAFSSLSSMLRDAMDDELIDANPAQRLRVRISDPRLNPVRPQRVRRAIPADEVGLFMREMPPAYHALCWTPFLSGVRPGELFGLERGDLDRDGEMIYVHQTVDRYGHVQPGLKTTHHVRDRERRGRWTLFPASLLALVDAAPADTEGRLFPTPRGRHWSHRNFYARVWEPAQREAATTFSLYDARHTFSSRLLAAGLPLVEVAAWMGRSLRAGGEQLNMTTSKYAHATGELNSLALQELERYFTAAAWPALDRRADG